jgi:hypothetical protein
LTFIYLIYSLTNNKIILNYKIIFSFLIYYFGILLIYEMGIGDWGLGIGDWGLGIGPNPQSPIPNPQSPIPMENFLNKQFNYIFI